MLKTQTVSAENRSLCSDKSSLVYCSELLQTADEIFAFAKSDMTNEAEQVCCVRLGALHRDGLEWNPFKGRFCLKTTNFCSGNTFSDRVIVLMWIVLSQTTLPTSGLEGKLQRFWAIQQSYVFCWKKSSKAKETLYHFLVKHWCVKGVKLSLSVCLEGKHKPEIAGLRSVKCMLSNGTEHLFTDTGADVFIPAIASV